MVQISEERTDELIRAIVEKLKANRTILARSAHGRVTWRREKKGERIEVTLEPTL